MTEFGITYMTPSLKKQVGRFVSPLPLIALEERLRTLAGKILPRGYALSLVFAGEKTAQKLNVDYRNKDYVPNVLSFPLSDTAGEIYICPTVAQQQAPDYDHNAEEHLRFLFIHGCLHLTGLDHGEKMDMLEKKYLRLV